MKKITISLEEDILHFVDKQAQGNRSGYINALLVERRRSFLEAELIAALQRDAEDPDYQAEIEAWDSVVGDGVDASE